MIKKLLLLISFGLGSITAQTILPLITAPRVNIEKFKKENQDIKILAIMVEFQQDEFDLTKGDGTFGSIYTKEYGNSIIDPLPHDIFYFQDHLEFAKNYFTKVSNGNVEVNYTILPSIITVSKVMRDYSPSSGESFKLLGDLSKEAWQLAVDQNPNVDFSQYNLFTIFHAGVGKDISTNDLLGEAKDLPSIYLSLKSLKDFYGDSFSGFPTNGGNDITNTIILPETESREEAGIGGTSLIQLSINGLIVSSIASHLGLPDLFDTETGISAIGRFGLMDGQSLFAYAGLFPPEPSAWEKVFMGWEEPVLINSNSTNIKVAAKKIASESDAKIIKVPINSTEYYLIENRQRDAGSDGATLTYKIGGQTKSITFNEDLDNFNNAIVDTINGVVLDVDEFDWALPGSGILIWHIDEKIIDDNLAANRINVGDNRGVDLEEADGIQDIGVEFTTIFGDVVFAEGDEFDFWYSGNRSKLYKNIFSPNSKPNTNSNSGANSLITFSEFSSNSNTMSFNLNFGSELIDLVGTYVPSFYYQSLDNYYVSNNTSSEFTMLVDSSNLVYVNLITNETVIQTNFSSKELSLVSTVGQDYFIGAANANLNVGYLQNGEIIVQSVELGSKPSSQIISLLKDDVIEINVGMENGKVGTYSFNTVTKEQPAILEVKDYFQTAVNQIGQIDNKIFAESKNNFSDGTNIISFDTDISKFVITKNNENEIISIILLDDNTFQIIKNGSLINNFSVSSAGKINGFSIGDLKSDGENSIIFNDGNEVKAVNFLGSPLDNFPYQNLTVSQFLGFPVIADVNNDNFSDVISTSENGNVFAISGEDGKLVNGFPISTGGLFSGVQTINKRENDLLFSSLTKSNEIFFWSIKSNGKVDWGNKFGNNWNTSSLAGALSTNYISTFFPKNRTYNWPNPVYSNETFIRTYVAEDAKVKVTIFDLAGDLVDELSYNAVGGLDNEIAWDVSQIQSGAYLAHVEVNSNGKTESKIIKIAVIK